MKSAEEIVDAYDLTGSFRDVGELADCSHHKVKRYVAAREAVGQIDSPAVRPQLVGVPGRRPVERSTCPLTGRCRRTTSSRLCC